MTPHYRRAPWPHKTWTARIWDHRARPIVQAVAIAVVGAFIIKVFARFVLGAGIPYALILVVLLAVTLGHLMIVPLRPPPSLTAPLRENTDSLTYGLPDRPFADVRRWEDRLDWRRGDPEYFGRTVLPAIGAVVDERLRLKHAVNRQTEPDRARAIVGPTVWEFLQAGQDRRKAPSPAELAAVVKELEQL